MLATLAIGNGRENGPQLPLVSETCSIDSGVLLSYSLCLHLHVTSLILHLGPKPRDHWTRPGHPQRKRAIAMPLHLRPRLRLWASHIRSIVRDVRP